MVHNSWDYLIVAENARCEHTEDHSNMSDDEEDGDKHRMEHISMRLVFSEQV